MRVSFPEYKARCSSLRIAIPCRIRTNALGCIEVNPNMKFMTTFRIRSLEGARSVGAGWNDANSGKQRLRETVL